MDVKSVAKIKYSYDLDGVSLKEITTSNVVTTEVQRLNLLIKKLSSSEYFKPNDLMTYTIIVSNTGDSTTKNIIIEDSIASQELIHNSLKLYFINREDNSRSLNSEVIEDFLVLKLPFLEAGDICVITYKAVILDNTDLLEPFISIRSDEVNYIESYGKPIKQGYAKLECYKSVNQDYTYLNTDLTYSLILKNIGNVSAYGVEVFDELPTTFVIESLTSNDIDSSKILYKYDNNVLSFVLNEVPPLNEITILINGKIVN